MYRIGQEEVDAVARVIASKNLFRFGGTECDAFEKEWAEKIGVKHALLNSGGGTAALTIALAACEIGPGDEVLVPAYTWIATASSVLTAGAIPVLCEIDETMTIDPEDIRKKITPQTKAIIPVHMAGKPCKMDVICEIAKAQNIRVIEDCCQDDGGTYKGKHVGTFGDMGCFSFNYFKIISSGEGGAVVTNDKDLFVKAAIYADCGTSFWSELEINTPIYVAQQFRADEIQGAIMREQLKKLDSILADLRRVRKTIMTKLSDVLDFIPSNDNEGDAGVNAVVRFKDEAAARAWCEKSGVGGLGIDHGKHVFSNWTPIKSKLVNHVPAMNPFNFELNKNLRANYDDSVAPKTLELLKRYVFIAVDPDITEENLNIMIEKMRAACK